MPVTVQALVLADHIYRDGATGKHVVAGTFHQIAMPELPATLPLSVGVFIVLSGLEGDTELGLQFVEPDGDVLLDLQGIELSVGDEIESIELGLEVPPLPLPRAGRYAMRVTLDGAVLAEAPVRVGVAA
jgi:hypothetical protein